MSLRGMTWFTMELLTGAQAGEKKGSRCLLLPPFSHLALLHPVSVTLYALCIKKNKNKMLAHTSTVKIKKKSLRSRL